MAAAQSVWGIELGVDGLRALRCRAANDEGMLRADVFEYIEYVRILNPRASEPAASIRGAVEQLLSRHDFDGATVAVGLPGRRALMKWLRLPPIDSGKMPDVIRHEMRMQVPFPLDEVVWCWQLLPGYGEDSGFLLEAEVVLLAVRREDVRDAITPLQEAGIRIDILQADTLALANMAAFDQLRLPVPCWPETPQPAVAVVSLEDHRTDIVLTNGSQVCVGTWPFGGMGFTEAIRRAGQSATSADEQPESSRAVEEDADGGDETTPAATVELGAALEIIFGYWAEHRAMTPGKVLLSGKGSSLSLLPEWLNQRLDVGVERLERFTRLDCDALASSSVFRDHRRSCGIAYGLAVQAASRGIIRTNLLPFEGVGG